MAWVRSVTHMLAPLLRVSLTAAISTCAPEAKSENTFKKNSRAWLCALRLSKNNYSRLKTESRVRRVQRHTTCLNLTSFCSFSRFFSSLCSARSSIGTSLLHGHRKRKCEGCGKGRGRERDDERETTRIKKRWKKKENHCACQPTDSWPKVFPFAILLQCHFDCYVQLTLY